MEAAEANKQIKRIGFWRRQFAPEATNSQRVFDWVLGIVLPVICVAADPVVFKGYNMMHPGRGVILGEYKPFAYILSFVSIMSMITWLLFGKRLAAAGPVFAGLFAFGSAISLAVGVVLLPFSILGLVVFIGALGFTPFFSTFVYLRNSFRAYHAAGPFFEKRTLRSIFLVAALFSGAAPFAINVEIDRRIDKMIGGDAQSIYNDAERLKYYSPIINFDSVALAACGTQDPLRRKALQDAYLIFIGQNKLPAEVPFCGFD